MASADMTNLIHALDHAAVQNDRWLFLFAIALMMAGATLAIRWLVVELRTQSERMGGVLQANTDALREIRSAIEGCRHHLHLLLLALLLLTGCVQTTVQSDGVTVSTKRFLWPGAITAATIQTTNGSLLRLEGYKSEPEKIAGAVANGVATGLGSALKP